MAFCHFNQFNDDAFSDVKEIRKAIVDKSANFEGLSVQQKNILLEYYRRAQRYVGLDLDVVKRRISANNDPEKNPGLAAKQTMLNTRLKTIADEIEENLRVSGVSIFYYFLEIVTHPLPQKPYKIRRRQKISYSIPLLVAAQ